MSDKFVFLIDDDIDDRFIFGEALKEIDPEIKFEFACDGIDAIKKLENMNGYLPTVIFTDLNMPKLNGLELLLRLKKHNLLKEVPVIAYSTSSRNKERSQLLENGAVQYMTKHTSFETLRNELRHILLPFIAG